MNRKQHRRRAAIKRAAIKRAVHRFQEIADKFAERRVLKMLWQQGKRISDTDHTVQHIRALGLHDELVQMQRCVYQTAQDTMLDNYVDEYAHMRDAAKALAMYIVQNELLKVEKHLIGTTRYRRYELLIGGGRRG